MKVKQLLLLLFLAILSFSLACEEDSDDGASSNEKPQIKFVFDSGCPTNAQVKIYIDNELIDQVFSNGSFSYDVSTGRHSYTIRGSNTNNVIWEGQTDKLSSGQTARITLLCN